MKNRFLECGRILNTHGVRGCVTVESYCDSARVFASLRTVFLLRGGEYAPMKMISASPHKNLLLVSFEGIDSLDKAIALKGKLLYASREDIPLPPGGYFIADLISLPVYNADTHKLYGKIRAVDNVCGRYIYTIDTGEGDVLFPAVPEFIDRCDTDSGLYIRPIEGFFNEI